MKTRTNRSYLIIAATALATSLPGTVRAQSSNVDPSTDPVVVKARETAKAVAASLPSATPLPPAPSTAPASLKGAIPPPLDMSGLPPHSASLNSPAPAPSGSSAPVASGASAAAGKTPVTVTTAGGGVTAIPAGAPVIIVQAAPAAPANPSGLVEPTANNWIGGLVGLGLLGALAFFGIRAAKNRGMTVEDTLKKLGVETPATAPVGTPFSQLKPAPAPLPPLPSLTDLPLAGPASAAGLAMGNVATAQRTTALIGVAGPVAGERFDLENEPLPFSVGRDDVNSLALTGDGAISRKHAQIAREGSKWTVGDLGSSNGTFVNGVRVVGQQPLRMGDEIQIGGSRFRFEG